MADDEPSPHAFAGFNKTGNVPTLVGNWVEERAALESTGVARYEPWVASEDPVAMETSTSSIYATRARASEMPTMPRVIEHIEQTHPHDWRTMSQVSYVDHKITPKLQETKEVSPLGPRARMELEMLRAVARDLPPEVEHKLVPPPQPPTLDTTYTADFIDMDMTAGGLNTFGARVMKDRDGRPAVRDPTFLAETQIVQRQLGDRVFGETAKRAGATQSMVLPDPEVPVTIYSEAVATRKYGGNIYGTRPMPGAATAFGKNTNFSKPMSEYNKVAIDE